MKKIIFSTYDSIENPYFGGGGAVAIHEVSKRMKNKFDVSVISGKYPDSKDKVVDGVNYKFIGLNTTIPQLDQLIFSLCLPFYVLTCNFDVWIESFTPPFSTNFLQLFTQKPVVGLAHMLSSKDMERKYKLPFSLIENVGLKTYKYMIVNSDSIKNIVLSVNKKLKILVAGNGVENIKSKNKNGKYLLFIGRLEIDQKGIDLLISSFEKVNEKLIIAGDGKDLNKIKQLISKLNLQDKITLTGKVSGAKKDKLFKNAKFVVVPSRFETFSIAALEAFSYGLPVVSFSIEGLNWFPKGSSIRVSAFDVDKYSEAISKLAKNSKLVNKMGAVGKSYAKKHTWDVVTNKYKDYLINI
jgi:glycosyltransferase involved in cell wall biosynthesis